MTPCVHSGGRRRLEGQEESSSPFLPIDHHFVSPTPSTCSSGKFAVLSQDGCSSGASDCSHFDLWQENVPFGF